MIRHISLLIVILCLLLSSCTLLSDKKNIPEGFSKLTVVIEDSTNFYLDKVFAKRLDSEFKFSRNFDTIQKGTVFICDSLRNNEYEIVFSSLLNRSFKVPISIIGDTIIFIRKNQLPNFDTLQSVKNFLTNMRQNDTICIAYTSTGCFHNYSSKTIIYKKEHNFIAEFTTDTSHDYKKSQILSIKKQLGMGFADTLHKLELGCMEGLNKQNDMQIICNKLKSKAKNKFDSLRADMIMFSSTTSSVIFINKGNKVFKLSSNGINEIPYFWNFMEALKL